MTERLIGHQSTHQRVLIMNEQLTMYDVLTPVPPMWDCAETCKHYGEKVDYPSWWFGKARCLLCDHEHYKSIVFDNRYFSYCTRYEREEE